MSTIAVPNSRRRSRISRRICAWMVTSSAVVGSSASSTAGRQASAIAIITRWRMPPESWCGYSSARRSGFGNAHAPQQLDRARPRVAAPEALVQDQRLGDLPADAHDRIERGHRLLEHHRDGVAADAAHLGFGKPDQLAAVEPDAAFDPPGRVRHQTHDGERRHALAAAGFADHAEDFAARERPAHVVDRAHDAVGRVERGAQVLDRKHRLRAEAIGSTGDAARHRAHSRFAKRGSSMSRRPSPIRLMASTVTASTSAGREDDPGREQEVGAPLRHDVAPARHFRRRAGAEERQQRLDQDRGGADVGRLHGQRRQRVGQDVAEQDLAEAAADDDGGLDIGLLADRQHDAAHQAHHARHLDDRDGDDDGRDAGLDHRHQGDGEQDRRDRHQAVHEAHQDGVGDAAVAADEPDQQPDRRSTARPPPGRRRARRGRHGSCGSRRRGRCRRCRTDGRTTAAACASADRGTADRGASARARTAWRRSRPREWRRRARRSDGAAHARRGCGACGRRLGSVRSGQPGRSCAQYRMRGSITT